MWEYCCNPLKRNRVSVFFFSRNAFPICFWDGATSTVKSFHLATTLQFSKTVKQRLSCKHLSKSPPRQHKGSRRRRDLPSFLKHSTWWTAFLNPGLSGRSLSGARKPVVSTTRHKVELFLEQSAIDLCRPAGAFASSTWTWRTGYLENYLKLANFLSMGFLVVLLILGAEGWSRKSHYMVKSKKTHFHMWLLILIRIILHT